MARGIYTYVKKNKAGGGDLPDGPGLRICAFPERSVGLIPGRATCAAWPERTKDVE